MRPGPVRSRQSYRHEAFLWKGPDDFVGGLLPFIEEGVDAGEAVLVAVIPEHAEWLADGLGSKAARVDFVDITQLGRNPARIIPACQQFLDDRSGYGWPARAIGEPLWDGRSPEEVLECQLHEALMNLAVDPEMPFWVVCPYDAGHLDVEVLAEASRSHPALTTATSYQGSPRYRGHEHARNLFAADLPRMAGRPTEVSVTAARLADAAERLVRHATSVNLTSDQVVSLTDVIRRLAADSLGRGAKELWLRWWDRPDVFVCEVADTTVIRDLLVGRHLPSSRQQDALWVANHVCDLVQVRSGAGGTVVRMHLRTSRAAAP